MLSDDAFHIGRIIKIHGVSGQVSVATDIRIMDADDWPDWIFLDIDAGLVPFRTREKGMIRRDEKHLVITLDEISSQDKAQKLVGYEVWFPKEFKFLVADSKSEISPLVGYLLSDARGTEVGRIEDFIDLPENPLFQVIYEGKEILIPARAEWIIDIYEEGKRIVMDLPDGLVDFTG